ncbi:MAG TPA: hydrogenase maturation nickel metallochaperone HypA [Pyrinomonadaceae bacterium]|nr:hydrogenase maturation nickel metallochaperone HypA [Pyrinomonadaceae bacterium]
MHELSIALSMIEMASEEAQRLGAERVNAIHLKVGALSGVVKDALLFSYEVASKGTLLEDSLLTIEETPVVIYCAACGLEKELPSLQRFCCPDCGELAARVVRGRELELVSMEIEESPADYEGAESPSVREEVGKAEEAAT